LAIPRIWGERFHNNPDPRLKNIITDLVRHLQDFVREVDLTFDGKTMANRKVAAEESSAAPESGGQEAS